MKIRSTFTISYLKIFGVSFSTFKRNETTVFILFKYLLQLMLYMLHILVDGHLLNSALLI